MQRGNRRRWAVHTQSCEHKKHSLIGRDQPSNEPARELEIFVGSRKRENPPWTSSTSLLYWSWPVLYKATSNNVNAGNACSRKTVLITSECGLSYQVSTSREVNEARRPHTCSRPCAFKKNKKKNEKIPPHQKHATKSTAARRPQPPRDGARRNTSHALAHARPLP